MFEPIEQRLASEKNKSIVVCVDEVGRGAFFGPVTVGATLIPVTELAVLANEPLHDEVRDSKKLSETTREHLAPLIDQRMCSAVNHASVGRIDHYNINEAIKYAVYRISRRLLRQVHASVDEALIIIDGNYRFEYPAISMQEPMPEIEAVVGGDDSCFGIASASVLAKVARDRLMRQAATRFPEYQLERNMGYGTEEHRRALRKHGPTRLHRRSFVHGYAKL